MWDEADDAVHLPSSHTIRQELPDWHLEHYYSLRRGTQQHLETCCIDESWWSKVNAKPRCEAPRHPDMLTVNSDLHVGISPSLTMMISMTFAAWSTRHLFHSN